MSRLESLRSLLRGRLASFGHAIAGALEVLRSEPNAWIHLAATAMVCALGLWLDLPARDWALLFGAMGMVFCAEALNTAIESVADEISLEHRPRIGRAKDAAAGGVLFAAVAAAAIGFCVLGPPLWSALGLG